MNSVTLLYSLIIAKVWQIANAEASSEVTIKSPRVTNWGYWGFMELCPKGTYVSGMQLKVQESQGSKIDAPFVNGMRFHCSDFLLRVTAKSPNRPFKEIAKKISSQVGIRGEWSPNVSCDDAGFVVGFQLKVEEEKNRRINDIQIICAQIDLPLWNASISTGKRLGEWGESQICPPLMAVCGIQTQVDENTADATGLNNVDMKCCSFPEETSTFQSCSPSFNMFLNRVERPDPVDKDTHIKLNFTHSILWNYWANTLKEFEDHPIAVPDMPKKLIEIFTSNLSVITLEEHPIYEWNRSSRVLLKNNSEIRFVSVTTGAGYITNLWQIEGYCGWLKLYDDCFIQNEFEEKGEHKRIRRICSGSGSSIVLNGLMRQTKALKMALIGIIVLIHF